MLEECEVSEFVNWSFLFGVVSWWVAQSAVLFFWLGLNVQVGHIVPNFKFLTLVLWLSWYWLA